VQWACVESLAVVRFNLEFDMPILTQNELKLLLHYDPDTGFFTRLKTVSSNAVFGSKAGWINDEGYICIGIKGKAYKAHRLAFLYMTGAFPKNDCDHINMIKSDNRWINLRESTKSENRCNIKRMANNTTGHKGVTFNKRDNVYVAQIKINKKHIYLGSFKDVDDAARCYKNNVEKYHGEFARVS
jgi:hypothetical protein